MTLYNSLSINFSEIDQEIDKDCYITAHYKTTLCVIFSQMHSSKDAKLIDLAMYMTVRMGKSLIYA